MIVDNHHRINRLKKLFYMGAAVFAISSLIFFLWRKDASGFIAAGVLLLWFLVWQFVDIQYVRFELTEEKLLLKYYSIVKFGRKDYNSIEFPVHNLYDYRLEKSVFGLVPDLILLMRTSRGIAEFPPVSLAALKKEERRHIEHQLREHLTSKPNYPSTDGTT
jgi:hypothetical protein